jgi:hypothetical protein
MQTASVLRVESRQGEHAEKLAQIDDRQMQFSIQHAYHHQEVSIKIVSPHPVSTLGGPLIYPCRTPLPSTFPLSPFIQDLPFYLAGE